jgi:hypothetical protein
MFCLARSDWPRLISIMDRFGKVHRLKRIGDVDELPNLKPILNTALAGGYNYYFGDSLDLWFTSHPFNEGVIAFSVTHRDKRPTHEQWELARSLLREIRPLTWPVSGTRENPRCEPSKAYSNSTMT